MMIYVDALAAWMVIMLLVMSVVSAVVFENMKVALIGLLLMVLVSAVGIMLSSTVVSLC